MGLRRGRNLNSNAADAGHYVVEEISTAPLLTLAITSWASLKKRKCVSSEIDGSIIQNMKTHQIALQQPIS
ncbi:unnamed protein product [Dovyalis caffra]|uniref:Uncharacterized protein n=1 Tax=Dovyalis caffra TaxID=77055 RepID=A0AAV1SQQ3_9ROSI|nr:unnamed protein product [Dovyalis caffra]